MQARSCLLAFFMESLIALCCEHSENCERATENACSDWDTDLCSLEKSPWLPRLVGPLRGQSQTCSSTSSLVQSKSSKTGLFYWHCGAKRRECGGLHLPQLREIGQGPQPFHYFQGGPWSLEDDALVEGKEKTRRKRAQRQQQRGLEDVDARASLRLTHSLQILTSGQA